MAVIQNYVKQQEVSTGKKVKIPKCDFCGLHQADVWWCGEKDFFICSACCVRASSALLADVVGERIIRGLPKKHMLEKAESLLEKFKVHFYQTISFHFQKALDKEDEK